MAICPGKYFHITHLQGHIQACTQRHQGRYLMKVYEGNRCSFLLFDAGEIWNFTTKKSKNRRSLCKLPANTLLIRSILKLEGIYVQEIPGASLVAYSSLQYSLPLLVNRTQNSPLVMPILGKLCKAFEAWKSQYDQSLLTMNYLQLEHRNLCNCLCLLD